MMHKRVRLPGATATDLFAGAGGSSTGFVDAGMDVRMASNHWALAVETHNTNHPDTDHDLADISQVDPRRYPTTDILWGSPECTNHSVAKGRKRITAMDLEPDLFGDKPLPDEAADRSRATMWDIPRFAEHHRYRYVVTENVVDAYRWVMFPAWLQAMELLGYNHEVVWLNSMHAQLGGLPAPQSRDRMYVVFWRRDQPRPELERVTSPQAWCPRCETVVETRQVFKKAPAWGRYKAQYVYQCRDLACSTTVEPGWLPAATAIDWSLPAERIGDRKRPLSAKTMARIKEGLRRYGATPVAIDAVRSAPILSPVRKEPFATSTTAYTRSLLIPVEGRDGKRAESAMEALHTQTTRNETGLLVPAGGTWHDDAHPTDEAMRTLTTREAHGLLMPYYGATKSAQPTTEAMGTLTTVDRYALITLRGQNAPKAVTDTLDTVTAGGNHHGLLDVTDAMVEACRFRMLEPDEIKRGMAFPHEYVMLGTKREQVKLSGNAVTPPASRDLALVIADAMERAA